MLNGIDISNYQSGLALKIVPADFVIVKVSQGMTYQNPSFSRHAQETLSLKRKLGLYHFLESGNAVSQADYFISLAKQYVNQAVLCLDFERYQQNGSWYCPTVADAQKFLQRIVTKTGVKPLIYMGLSDENNLAWDSLVRAGYPLWVAQYNSAVRPIYGYQPRPLYGKTKNWNAPIIFQYTGLGRLQGWSSNLDLDVFYGTEEDWDNLAGVKNGESGVDEMSWSVDVPADAFGAVLITKNTRVYKDAELTKEAGRDLKKSSEWIATGIKKGAICLGGDQWIDGRDAVLKLNPVRDNPGADGVVIVIADDLWTQAEPNAGQPGLKHLKKGSTWRVFGSTDDLAYLDVGGDQWIAVKKIKIRL